ncbi:MAG: TolC family protein [Bacteroidales bacterium]|nr:TolC family protein [Bacteroidales bacterium]
MMKSPITFFLLAFFVSVSSMVSAQEKLELSMEQARQYALNNNTDIKNSILSLESANKKIWETTAIGLPQVTAKAAYQNIFKVPTVMFGDPNDPNTQEIALGVKENTTVDFTVSQLLFSGAYIVGLQASRIYYQLSNQSLTKTRTEIVETINDTYTMILVAEESSKILRDNLTNVSKTLDEIKAMHQEGFVEITDVDQLELSLNSIKNSLAQVDNNTDLGYRLLKIQLGIDPAQQIVLTNKLEEVVNVDAISNAISSEFNIEKNIDFQLVKTQEKLALLDLRRERTEYLPTVSAFYNRTEKMNKPEFDFAPKDVFGVNVSLPIFSSGQRMAKVSQKKLAYKQVQNSREFVSRSLSLQAQQYQYDLGIKMSMYQNQKKSMDLSKQIYERTLLKYKEGVSSSMDLMNAQNQYLLSLSSYYQSIFDMIKSKNKLDKTFSNYAL